jgi:hypothetical protein
MNFPYKHFAGDTLDFQVSVPDYLPSAGWTLVYRLTPRFTSPAQAAIEINAIANSDGTYQVQASPATTAAWVAGAYGWTRWVTKGAGAAVQTLASSDDQGEVNVLANPRTSAAGYDSRSHARKMLESIETALEAFATSPVMKSYAIGTRQYMRADIPDLLVLRDRYRSEAANEDAAAQVAAGLGNPRNIGVRFNRA